MWDMFRAMQVAIRDEGAADVAAIRDLTAAAFAPMAFSDGTEPAIIDALRDAGDLVLSLVAAAEGAVVGHVAFSPVTIGGVHRGWFGLGPIAVLPGLQRQGIGRALIAAGLARLRDRGAQGCALIGDPGYYGPLGFESDGRLTHGTLDRRYVQWLTLAGTAPMGELQFAAGFDIGQAE
jgi:putative acetyltransferase